MAFTISYAEISIFQPKDGQVFDDGFNIVAQRVGSAETPGKVEIASDDSFNDVKIVSESWVAIEDWWQLAIPKGSLDNGTYWLRIDGDNNKIVKFTVNIPLVGDAVIRDPWFYGSVNHLSGKSYTLTNLWMRSEGTGNGLNEDRIEGAVNNYMIIHDGYLYKPVFRTNYTVKLSESPQQLRRIDLTTGKDDLVDFTTPISYYQNRRFEAIGTDDAGTPWIASVFNTFGSEDPLKSEETDYFKNVLNSDTHTQDAIVLGTLDFNPDGNRIKNLKVLKITDIKKNLGNSGVNWKYRLLTTDLKVKGDYLGDDFRVTTAISVRFLKNKSEYSVYSWSPTNIKNSTSGFASYKNIQGTLAQTAPYNDNFIWVNSSDYTDVSDRVHVPLQFCNKLTGDTIFTIGLDQETSALRKACLEEGKPFDGGTSVCSFELEGNKFLIYPLVITPYVRFALVALPNETPKSASDVRQMFRFPEQDLGSGAVYRNETLSGIYVDVHDSSTAKADNKANESSSTATPYADIYVYAGFNMLGAYRLHSFIITGVEDIATVKPDVVIKVKDRIMSVSGIKGIKTVDIFNFLGEKVLTGYVDSSRDKMDLQILPSGLYIASVEGEKPCKFVIH